MKGTSIAERTADGRRESASATEADGASAEASTENHDERSRTSLMLRSTTGPTDSSSPTSE